MKLLVSKNTLWCNTFTARLSELGVKHVCISPGSRSTSLTLSFASNKKFNVYPIVDERSSSFFALGLAKQSKTPVAIVTTSGTAVAELYPAIIEAYYQRVPLIICTADRPQILRGSGANQTINQHNIFNNHIRLFKDAGLPNLHNLSSVRKLAELAIHIATKLDRGPVHLNFPFEKPFEPDTITDIVDETELENISNKNSFLFPEPKQPKLNIPFLSKLFAGKNRGLILVGYNNYKEDFPKLLIEFSNKYNYPIYIDGACGLRFGKHEKDNIVENLTSIVRSENFQKNYDPDLIIQFGATPTANVLLDFFKNSNAKKILVNEFGDRNDPSLTAKKILKVNPSNFCKEVLNDNKSQKNKNAEWLDDFKAINLVARVTKEKFIQNSAFPFEGRIGLEALNSLTDNSNLMISNSLPIRDIDFFAPTLNKQINLFTNRGASGIDGINSTALGIAKSSGKKTFLIVGDLAFFHDMNGLHNAIKYKIPLTIILVNNSGGGIFESLPIAGYKDFMKQNFLTPLKINFRKFVEAYGGNFISIKDWTHLKKELKFSYGNRNLTVLEIKTDAKRSKLIRQKYWSAVAKIVDQHINEVKNRRHPISPSDR
jgi:2-succinyl-5-enolpyruvyl-6-hydroxy-3-cyclohexene-1-carboxylate synthase